MDQKTQIRTRRGGTPAKLGIEQLEPRCMLSVNVTTWHNDLTRQGDNTAETILTPANVNSSSFGKLFSYAVTGQVYAEPLYASNLNMGGLGTHNVVFVATENNDVYAFDAVNNGAGGGQLWHVNLGLAANVTAATFGGGRYGPYSDITPQVGITSTPVIDLATNTMYIDSFRDDGGTYSHHIWALDITSGATKNSITVAASIQGNNPADSSGGIITFNAHQAIQRSALTLLNGVVYAAYAGYADTDPYHGWILGFDSSNLNLTKVFNVTPRLSASEDAHQGEGGIWMAGAGMVSDGTHLYVLTGNGDFDASVGDYGDTILELTPDNSTQPTNKNGYGLSVTDYFTPYNEQTLADNDTDLGSAGPMLLPTQTGAHPNELIGTGKGGVIYLVDRDNLGGHNPLSAGNDNNIVQSVATNRAPGSAAYYNGMIYLHGYNTGVLKAFSISNGLMSPAAIASGTTSYQFPGATPSISSYGASANGIVWEIQYSTANAVLRAYNATPNGSALTQLYSSGTAIAAGVKFAVPTVADGRVYVGSSGAISVFGLTSNAIAAPSAPTGLAATSSTVQGPKVQLTWTDTANNENAFKIERSASGGPFTQIAIASVNATTYTDTTIVPGITYTYRVRATNPVGDSGYSNTADATIVVAPPVTIYHFDDGSGNFAADSSGSNTGVLVGATKPQWVAGQIGSGALSFSGNGAYNQTNQSAVQVSSNLVTPLGGTSTFSVWVNTTQTGSNNHQQAPAITGVDQLGTTGDINWGTLDASGRIGIYVGDAGGVYSTNPINDGQWHNVTMTRDMTTGTVQLYIDGTLNSSGSFDTGFKAAQFYLIGALTIRNSAGNVTGATYFNGQLDDIKIYNRVLSAPEIQQLGQPPSAPASLTATQVADSSSMLQLTWTNTSGVAQNVAVERKTGANGAYEQIAVLSGTESTYFDTGLEPGTQYYYRVQATASGGASDYSNESIASPPRAEVVGRFVFYNRSSFDGQNGSSNVLDGFALAPDKQALLPGETATAANYTNYTKGLNGIMIDVANFAGSITPDDYTIMVGNSNDINTWQPVPDPSFVTEYVGAGVNGSVRLELVWDDYTIQNEWVQVTLKADANTGLIDDDVFYFGNAVGDTGNSTADAIVDGADVLAVQNHQTSSATITNAYDFNRDKVVDATDVAIAQANTSNPSPLLLISVPGLPHGASIGDGAVVVASGAGSIEMLALPVDATAGNDTISSFSPSVSSGGFLIAPAPLARATVVDSVLESACHHPDPSGSNNLLEILAAVHSRHASNSDASSAPRNVDTRSDADSTIDDVVMSDAFHQWSEKFELRFHHKVFAGRA